MVVRRWASGHRFLSSLPSRLRSVWLLLRWDCLPLNAPAFAGRTTVLDRLRSHGSCHSRRAAALQVMNGGFLPSPVDQVDHDPNGPPPSLHGHLPASWLLRSSPPRLGVSVLSASRVIRLRLFPWHHRAGSQVPHQSQDQSHASSTPDITWTVTRFPPCSSRRKCRSPVLMSSVCISRPYPEVHLRSSLWTPHDVIASRLFRNVHHLCHWAEAAYGC
jgi:hypothetical protein